MLDVRLFTLDDYLACVVVSDIRDISRAGPSPGSVINISKHTEHGEHAPESVSMKIIRNQAGFV